MAFFEVQPDLLTGQAPVISGYSDTLGVLEQQLRAIAAAAAATGFADAGAALQRFSEVASTRTELMRAAVGGIGDATGRSGVAYMRVDRQVAQDIVEAGEQLASGAD